MKRKPRVKAVKDKTRILVVYIPDRTALGSCLVVSISNVRVVLIE
jgi:hypothetical protein